MKDRTTLQQQVMQRLHGEDIWLGVDVAIDPARQVAPTEANPGPQSKATSWPPTGDELRDVLEDSTKEDIQGWNGLHGLLVRLAAQPIEKVVFDVGVWKGQSTVTLAKSIRYSGKDGCVISIDTFLGSVEHWLGAASGLFTRKQGRPDLYEQFLNNVAKAGVSDLVVPFPLTSQEAAKTLKYLGIKADVIHVDAAHDYESVKQDISAYWELVKPGGFLVGDDYTPEWPGVVQAVDEFVAKKDLKMRLSSPKWAVKKRHGPNRTGA